MTVAIDSIIYGGLEESIEDPPGNARGRAHVRIMLSAQSPETGERSGGGGANGPVRRREWSGGGGFDFRLRDRGGD